MSKASGKTEKKPLVPSRVTRVLCVLSRATQTCTSFPVFLVPAAWSLHSVRDSSWDPFSTLGTFATMGTFATSQTDTLKEKVGMWDVTWATLFSSAVLSAENYDPDFPMKISFTILNCQALLGRCRGNSISLLSDRLLSVERQQLGAVATVSDFLPAQFLIWTDKFFTKSWLRVRFRKHEQTQNPRSSDLI